MAVLHSTPPGRVRRFCFGAIRIAVCLFAIGLIAMDAAAGQLSLVSAAAIYLCLEQRTVAASILNKGAELRHFLRDDHEAVEGKG